MRRRIILVALCTLLSGIFIVPITASTLFSVNNASDTVNLGHDEIYVRPVVLNPAGNDFSIYFANSKTEEECICTARGIDEAYLFKPIFPICEEIPDYKAYKRCLRTAMWRIQHFDKVLAMSPHPNYNDLYESYKNCMVRVTGYVPGRDWTPRLRLNTENPNWGNPSPDMFRENSADLFCPLPAQECPIDNCKTAADCHEWYSMGQLSQSQKNAFYSVCLSRLTN